MPIICLEQRLALLKFDQARRAYPWDIKAAAVAGSAVEHRVKCLRQFVRNASKSAAFPLNQAVIARFIVEIVSLNAKQAEAVKKFFLQK